MTDDFDRELYRDLEVLLEDPRAGRFGSFEDDVEAALDFSRASWTSREDLRKATLVELELRPGVVPGPACWGGDADVPPHFDWPHGPHGPLFFMFQLDLARLPRLPHDLLPGHGLLQLYLGEGDYPEEPMMRVFHHTGPTEKRKQPAFELTEFAEIGPPPHQYLAARPRLSAPWEFTWNGQRLYHGVDRVVVDRYLEALQVTNRPLRPSEIRVLGYADEVAEDGRKYAAERISGTEPGEWMALFVCEAPFPALVSEPPGWAVMIHRDDLRMRRFDRASLARPV
jgi:hypothetical protein